MRKFLPFLALLSLACSDDVAPLLDHGGAVKDGGVLDGATVDSGPDSGIPLTLPKGGTGHTKVGDTLKTGEVRAGKVTDKIQLLSGVKVEGRVGDYKIYNEKVAFIIQDARVSDGWNPYGGEVIDASRVGGSSLLGEMVMAVYVNIMKPSSVGVINDGSDGKAAIIRAMGSPAIVPYLASVMGDTFGGKPSIHMAIDYILEPGSSALQIKHRLLNATNMKQTLPLMILALTGGDGAEWYAKDQGFSPKDMTKMDYVGMIGPTVGYALVSLEEKLLPLVSYSGVWVHSSEFKKQLPAAGEMTRSFHLVVADGEPEAVAREVRVLTKETGLTKVSGTVKDSAGTAVKGARIHVQKADSQKTYITMTRSDAKGAYSMELSPGKYTFTVVADGRAKVAATSVTVASAAVTQDLTVGTTGTIQVTVTDDTGVAIPAKVVYTGKISPGSYASTFGEKSFPHGAKFIDFTADGKSTAKLPPDTYTVHVSRGYEYEVAKSSVTLASGDSKTVSLKIKRSVDTTGYMCGDFHLHGMWSPDSSDLYDFKVRTLAAAGLEIPVTTDHEYIADYGPYIAKLGLQKWIYGIVGEELTTLIYGHFNIYPIKQDPTKSNMGAHVWYKQAAPKMFAEVKKTWPNSLTQVNHPRSAAMGGYFTYVGWDPKTGTFSTKKKGEWSKNFDSYEVFNSGAYKATKQEVIDWYSFLDRGFLVTGIGNSDSHNALNSEVGWPRNYVKLSTDIPANLSLTEFTKSIKDQKVVIGGGIFVTVSIGSKGMGEVVDASSGKVELQVKVQAPAWISATKLYVNLGGVEGKPITLDSSTADPKNAAVRYNGKIELKPAKDTYVHVAVTGSGSLAPVSRGSPFAMTNPIYLDVDGNGVYDAPKSF